MAPGGDPAAVDPEFQALVLSRYAADPRAIGELGARVLVGRDAPQSIADGAELIAEAARRGEPSAWSRVAVLAATGVGRAQSWADALDALARAAALGDADAQRQQALLAEAGLHTAAEIHGWLAAPAGTVVRDTPRLVAFPQFLTIAWCDYWRERARPKLVPAQVNDARGQGLKLDPMRTNTGAVFSLTESDLLMQLSRARIGRAAGVALEALEPPEVLHYSVGETYKPHLDFFHPKLPNLAEEMRLKGQRVKTCLVYLNDDFEGGETEFPRIGVKFRGRAGEALVFENVLPNGAGNMDTLHAGLPPTRGEKWLLSQWMRSEAQRVV